jgi:hypothetical protein
MYKFFGFLPRVAVALVGMVKAAPTPLTAASPPSQFTLSLSLHLSLSPVLSHSSSEFPLPLHSRHGALLASLSTASAAAPYRTLLLLFRFHGTASWRLHHGIGAGRADQRAAVGVGATSLAWRRASKQGEGRTFSIPHQQAVAPWHQGGA